MHFWKYQALGNDYLVVKEPESPLTPEGVAHLCDRHFGVGGDGVLVHRRNTRTDTGDSEPFGLQILNPDGSEAEKSGNGLRIFSRYLWDQGLVAEEPFVVDTLGGRVTCQILDGGRAARVCVGRATFDSEAIPVAGPRREVLQEPIEIAGQTLQYSAASVGNPHCVVLRDHASEEEARAWGPLLETEARFPNRTNVQLVEVVDPANLRIEIWERGAGYTLASGTSASAAAAVAHKLGLCESHVTVHMRGGPLKVEIDPTQEIQIEGPVSAIAEGTLSHPLPGPPEGSR